jgi:hypothetical protein
VLSVAPGALELLPNQLHPRPWLHVTVVRNTAQGERHAAPKDCLHLPNESQANPYDLYRDMNSWYRMINPDLADPANLYRDLKGGVIKKIREAINTAETFHDWLGDYYHPGSFAYYGADKSHPAYGRIRWVAHESSATAAIPVTAANIRAAKCVSQGSDGIRKVAIEDKIVLTFSIEQQDSAGDDTVSQQSGAGPGAKVRQLFATHGYRHQESYKNRDSILLTCYCIAKIAQELGKNG